MKVNIPGLPFEIVIIGVRKPPGTRWRIGVKGLLILVLISALLTWYGIGLFDHYARIPITKRYWVDDLLRPASPSARAPELAALAESLKSSVAPDFWSSRNRVITPSDYTYIKVMDSESGHKHIAAWLANRRLLRANNPVR